jgi:hypothetical protein
MANLSPWLSIKPVDVELTVINPMREAAWQVAIGLVLGMAPMPFPAGTSAALSATRC